MRSEHITILQGFQPYNAKERPTYIEVLSEINNTDKHRLIHTITTAAEELAPHAIVAYPGYRIQSSEFHPGRVVLEEGTEIGRVLILPTNPDPQMYMQSELGVTVAFGERD